MTVGSRRWSVTMVSTVGLLLLGAACIYRGYTQNLLDVVLGVIGVVAGYCGFAMPEKVARARAGTTDQQAVDTEKENP
jgi:hypothetical protein